MRLSGLREALVEAAAEVARRGLDGGEPASLSARDARTGWWLVTPEGQSLGGLAPKDLLLMSGAGEVLAGMGLPSSDWTVHMRVYAGHGEAGAVVMARPEWVRALAAQSRGIPPFHRRQGRLGGGVRCVPYAPAGSEALARLVAQALGTRAACLVAQQGATARGATPAEAVSALALVDRLAGAYGALIATGALPRSYGRTETAPAGPLEETDPAGG